MVSAKLFCSLAALTLNIGVQRQGTGSCVETITARSGDTCASLAELAGISVADFLRSNPWVSSCSTLITNGIYCKTGTATVRPTAPVPVGVPSNSPFTPLEVSKDGTCGRAITCSGSRFGRCCSAYGFCGSSADHCGEGCQLDFGECGDAASSSKPIPATPTEQEPGTVIVTMTVSVTDTYTVRASTSIVTVTATAVIPSTATVGSTSTVRATSSRRTRTTRASTTLVTTTTTATSTRRVRPTTTTTKSQGPPPKPSPVLPNTPRNCMLQHTRRAVFVPTRCELLADYLFFSWGLGKSYDLIRRGDNCQSVARRNELSLRELYVPTPLHPHPLTYCVHVRFCLVSL